MKAQLIKDAVFCFISFFILTGILSFYTYMDTGMWTCSPWWILCLIMGGIVYTALYNARLEEYSKEKEHKNGI
ncbi:hypothetical protein EUCA11A_10580 [Eubacterium callanderi]|uniref:hypothetical protein n=1 Tax=Eubacterium callanderi TaxID=53442 RepID=UPI0029FECC3B|nr:hypothetical protein [Eubacterium callanderi]WPK66905.1 hypothetical protein EUCA2A_10580 [Eubacterium callanderi]WPK71203.1 hypothetical protein EUCA11A_10580 [Eubacterium callanderi]